MPTDQTEPREVRPPAVAGMFYPREAEALRAMIEQAYRSPLGPGEIPTVGANPRRVLGIVAPHAGYQYSGQATAWSYAAAARGGRPEAIVLLGINHRGHGAPLALSPASGWETPLGVAPVATALGEELRALDDNVLPDARAHASEHSLEVQVPFIQQLFGDVPILPIVFSMVAYPVLRRLGEALAALARRHDLLLVASSDFSHYVSQTTAEHLDRMALEQIAALDPEGLLTTVRRNEISMCGVLPVTCILVAARNTGAVSAEILHYHTSGAVTGDSHEVVGYGAVAIFGS